MTVTSVIGDEVLLELGTDPSVIDIACQVIEFELTLPSDGDPTLVYTACPDGVVSEPGDPVKGSMTGEVFTDFSPQGVSRYLLDHRGQTVNYKVTYSPTVPDQAVTIEGTALVDAYKQPFTPRKTLRNPLALSVVTATVTYPTVP